MQNAPIKFNEMKKGGQQTTTTKTEQWSGNGEDTTRGMKTAGMVWRKGRSEKKNQRTDLLVSKFLNLFKTIFESFLFRMTLK